MKTHALKLLKCLWRCVKWVVMIIIAPFVLGYLLYLLLTGKYHPVWDGG